MEITNNNYQYISEIIGEDYKTWKKGDCIILSSGTNTGKTTFCVTLALNAIRTKEHVLYLVSRIAKQREQEKEIREKEQKLKAQGINVNLSNTIEVITYQKLEAAISNNTKSLYMYASCKYIFCDECHYFTDDVAIPDSTPSTSDAWIRAQPYPIKIYASATAEEYFAALIKHKNIPPNHVYTAPKSFDYITNIYFFKQIQLTQLIDRILRTEPDSKLLVYVNTSEQMSDLYDIYGLNFSDYLCSKTTRDKLLKKICNLRSGTPTVKISKRILFTTKTLDVGINIRDRHLKHIICEIPDINTMIQCFGRKRPIDSTDTCTFYIEDKTIHCFIPRRNEIQKHIDKYEEWKKDPVAFQNNHKNDRNLVKNGSLFYCRPGESDIRVDYTLLHNYRMFIKFYEEIKAKGYLQAVCDNIGKEFAERISVLPEAEKDEFLEYLISLEDKRLYKDDQTEFVAKFKEQMEKLNQQSRTYGIKILNKFLEQNYKNEYDKRIVSKKDQQRLIDGGQNPHYKQMYWILQ